MWVKVADFVLLQLGWFACVLGGAAGNVWIGPVSAVACIAIHLWIAPRSRAADIRNVLVFGALGCAADIAQVGLGWLEFGEQPGMLFGLPLWMASLWFLFPILFNTALTWMRPHLLIAAVFGIVGGPMAYIGGEALEALTVNTVIPIAVVWGVYTPAAMRFARRADT